MRNWGKNCRSGANSEIRAYQSQYFRPANRAGDSSKSLEYAIKLYPYEPRQYLRACATAKNVKRKMLQHDQDNW